MGGEKIIPSVTRFFNQQQTLYVFFQAYYPEKTDKADIRSKHAARRTDFLPEWNSGECDAAACAGHVDPKTRTASYRISLPLAKLPAGRYAVKRS